MELGGTCTLGTTRCLESWVLLSMRLFQSSKSTVLRDKAHQQSRQPEILGPTTWLYPPGRGCLGIRHTPAHSSRGYFQTWSSQNPPNVCFKRLNTALNYKRKSKPKHNYFCNASVAIKTQKVYREFHGQVRLKEEPRMQGQAGCRPRLRRLEKLMCWAA